MKIIVLKTYSHAHLFLYTTSRSIYKAMLATSTAAKLANRVPAHAWENAALMGVVTGLGTCSEDEGSEFSVSVERRPASAGMWRCIVRSIIAKRRVKNAAANVGKTLCHVSHGGGGDQYPKRIYDEYFIQKDSICM